MAWPVRLVLLLGLALAAGAQPLYCMTPRASVRGCEWGLRVLSNLFTAMGYLKFWDVLRHF